jgi:hypothetical protein
MSIIQSKSTSQVKIFKKQENVHHTHNYEMTDMMKLAVYKTTIINMSKDLKEDMIMREMEDIFKRTK